MKTTRARRFKGTVTIARSLAGPKLVRWREEGKPARFGVDGIPYCLATWLTLMPNRRQLGRYRNKFYQLDNDDLIALAEGGRLRGVTIPVGEKGSVIRKVTKKSSQYTLTLEL